MATSSHVFPPLCSMAWLLPRLLSLPHLPWLCSQCSKEGEHTHTHTHIYLTPFSQMWRLCNPFFTSHGLGLRWSYHLVTWLFTHLYCQFGALVLYLMWIPDILTFWRCVCVCVCVYGAPPPPPPPQECVFHSPVDNTGGRIPLPIWPYLQGGGRRGCHGRWETPSSNKVRKTGVM